jgi:hypothetical protein
MSALSEARATLADALEAADLHAFVTIPEDVDPPFVCVSPDEPYISYEGDIGLNFGEALVRHRLTLVAERGENEQEADQLDELILTVLGIDFEAEGFTVTEVGEPGSVPVNNQLHLGVNIRLQSIIRP